MNLAAYDYDLPPERIAQEPMTPREQAKLMVLQTKNISHHHIHDLPSLLLPTDVLVVNNTKVFNARLIGKLLKPDGTIKAIELFLIRPQGDCWQALAKPGKHITIGNTITIEDNFTCTVIDKKTDGTLLVNFDRSTSDVRRLADIYGTVPTPPYIKKSPAPGEYQTAYAKIVGSVAAPTAGFHLTPALLDQIKKQGVTIVEITLHVGLGTFQPIRSNTLEEHTMHSEWVEISDTAAAAITQAKAAGQRIIAIGTTTVRALEGVGYPLTPYSGDVNLFITPGFKFNIIDGLLTNFHLPKSTLLVLVSAFAGYDLIKTAYQAAIKEQYRFYSFGDAMLII